MSKTNKKPKPQPAIVIVGFPTEDVCLTTVEANGPSRIGAYYISTLSIRDDEADRVEDIKTPQWLQNLLIQAYHHGAECAQSALRRRLGL